MQLLPINNLIFKKIFGDPKNSNILIHFLNSVIKPSDPITRVEIAQTELTSEMFSTKSIRLDILAETNNHELIDIEMQKGKDDFMSYRSIYYWARLFTGQLATGDPYKNLKRTITISILDFNMFNDDRYWRKFHIKDDFDNQILNNLLELHFIELNKIQTINKDPITLWMKFLKYPNDAEALKVSEIKEAKKIYDVVQASPEVKELLRVQDKNIRDYNNDLLLALNEGIEKGKKEGIQEGIEIGRENGKQEGLLEGMQKGLETGLETGIKKGREEGEKKKMIEMALNMQNKGLDNQLIAECLGITQDELTNILN